MSLFLVFVLIWSSFLSISSTAHPDKTGSPSPTGPESILRQSACNEKDQESLLLHSTPTIPAQENIQPAAHRALPLGAWETDENGDWHFYPGKPPAKVISAFEPIEIELDFNEPDRLATQTFRKQALISACCAALVITYLSAIAYCVRRRRRKRQSSPPTPTEPATTAEAMPSDQPLKAES
jgi:hypothetical protein